MGNPEIEVMGDHWMKTDSIHVQPLKSFVHLYPCLMLVCCNYDYCCLCIALPIDIEKWIQQRQMSEQ